MNTHQKKRLTAIILFAFFLLVLTACGKGSKNQLVPLDIPPVEVEQDGISIMMDPRLELLLIAQRLAESPVFFVQHYGNAYSEYYTAADSFFAKYKEHPLIKTLKNLNKSQDVITASMVNLASYISPDFTQIEFPDGKCPAFIKEYWKKTDFKKFIADFNDFAVTSKFDKFLLVWDAEIKRALYDTREFCTVCSDFMPYIQNCFGNRENPMKITCISTTLDPGIFMAMPVQKNEDSSGSQRMFFPPFHFSRTEDSFFFMTYLCYWENFHLLYENWEQISESATAYINKVNIQTQNTQKIEKISTLEELSDALAISFLLDYVETPEIIEKLDITDEELQQVTDYLQNDAIFTAYKPFYGIAREFNKKRSAYKDFADYFQQEFPAFLESL